MIKRMQTQPIFPRITCHINIIDTKLVKTYSKYYSLQEIISSSKFRRRYNVLINHKIK